MSVEAGCGSNDITKTLPDAPTAVLQARTSAACPTCTPSKFPIVIAVPPLPLDAVWLLMHTMVLSVRALQRYPQVVRLSAPTSASNATAQVREPRPPGGSTFFKPC